MADELQPVLVSTTPHNQMTDVILDQLSDGVIVVTSAGDTLIYNQAAQRLVGPPQLRDHSDSAASDHFLPDMLTPFPFERLPLRCALRGEESRDITMFVRRSGDTGGHWVSASGRPLYAADGSISGAIAIYRDVSEQRWAAERLQAGEARFREIALNIPGAVFQITVSDGIWIMEYASERLAELVGRPVTALATDAYAIFDCIHPEDRADCRASIEESIATLKRWHFSGRVLRPDGSTRLCYGDARPTRDAHGDVIFLGMLTDATARQEADEARRQAALNEQIIAAQQAALEELSTPLIPISDDVMVMPLIGSIDSRRAQQVIAALLHGIEQSRTHTAILDITGVSVVDTQVANALIQAAQAARLLGVRVMLTGIRPEVAQTLVGLGVDLTGIITHGTLQSGIAAALRRRS